MEETEKRAAATTSTGNHAIITLMVKGISASALKKRAVAAMDILHNCRLCGHGCGADRLNGETGRCGAGAEVQVAAHLLHFGEEPPVSGKKGSGTIFFSGCPLSCVFCQNHKISQENQGQILSPAGLAGIMLDLKAQGAHNINLVSPTPWVPHIIAALAEARDQGLTLPLVYNTGGFDSLVALRLLDNIVDVYLPDAKYADKLAGVRYSGAGNYAVVNSLALREMFRQAGPLRTNADGLAAQGVLIRHLVLPHDLSGTGLVLSRLAREFGPGVWLSLMAQYFPCHLVVGNPDRFPELARPLTEAEYEAALDAAERLGLENVFIQELSASGSYVPDFGSPEVFARTD